MSPLNIVLLIFILICVCAIVIIALETPVGGNDVSNPRPLFDEKGRLRKKYLPFVILSLIIGIVLALLNSL